MRKHSSIGKTPEGWKPHTDLQQLGHRYWQQLGTAHRVKVNLHSFLQRYPELQDVRADELAEELISILNREYLHDKQVLLKRQKKEKVT